MLVPDSHFGRAWVVVGCGPVVAIRATFGVEAMLDQLLLHGPVSGPWDRQRDCDRDVPVGVQSRSPTSGLREIVPGVGSSVGLLVRGLWR